MPIPADATSTTTAAQAASAPKARRWVNWLDRPAGVLVGLVVLAVILAAPWWVLADEMHKFALFGDDFAYIAESRTGHTTVANLLVPHNTHIVPLFRVWTFALVAAAGNLSNLPAVFCAATYFGLVATMCVVGYFVAKETGRSAVSLVTMGALGISTVLERAVTWYSAGQALWAGAAIVLALILARSWSLKGGAWRFGLLVLALVAAPAVWTGGHAAGPAAAAYLWASRRPNARRGAVVLLAITVSAVLLELVLVRNELRAVPIIWEKHDELWPRPIQAVLHTAQAIAEAIVFGNLGLDALTTPLQATVVACGCAAVWAWSRGGWKRPSPLEAAGAAIMLCGYLMAYAFRGNLPFSSLREIGWYHAIPQVGAVLFAAGWWTAVTPASDDQAPHRLTRGQAIAVLLSVALLCQMQSPRAQRLLLSGAPPLTDVERRKFAIPELQRLRAMYFRENHHDRQIRQLARLGSAERICRKLGIGPASIRSAYGRILIPGIPELQRDTDAVSIMDLPRERAAVDPLRVRDELGDLLLPEPEPTPPWMDPNNPMYIDR